MRTTKEGPEGKVIRLEEGHLLTMHRSSSIC